MYNVYQLINSFRLRINGLVAIKWFPNGYVRQAITLLVFLYFVGKGTNRKGYPCCCVGWSGIEAWGGASTTHWLPPRYHKYHLRVDYTGLR